MPQPAFTESIVEEAALAWLAALGWTVRHGPDLAPGEPQAERVTFADVVLAGRLRNALARLNPALPPAALTEAVRRLGTTDAASLVARNRAFHLQLVNGVEVEYHAPDGALASAQVRVVDFDTPAANDWLAVNQVTVSETTVGVTHTRRPDIVLYVNGLPLGLIELKNAADEEATVWTAFQQLQTYKAELPRLFAHNALLVASDGVQARAGTLTSDRERFMPWRTVTGEALAPATASELEVLLGGMCEPQRFLDLVRWFTVFEGDGEGDPVKKMAGYHQYHAVNVALEETRRAALAPVDIAVDRVRDRGRFETRRPGGAEGDRRVGVVWHTQGSGKSLTMAFYAGRVIRDAAMANPTLVVLTDRNDLDEQLFTTFSRCRDLLRQDPVQAESRAHLRELLAVEAGGVVFTTVQKFAPEVQGDAHPLLTARRNVVVIADEAHRSQYDFLDGYARHLRDALPGASFIGFTGTPVEATDKNTRAVFGDYISVYDIQRAVEDRATVPIYYESRLAKLALSETARPTLDAAFEEVTEGEEVERKERLKSKWAQLEAVVGSDARLRLVAEDLVRHWESRRSALEGKGLIVCMSRRIAVELYRHLVALRPEWHADTDDAGVLKVVMTGSAADPLEWQPHIRPKARREALAKRMRNPADPLELVIVRDMWLTGFDAPPLHTLYVDKPMQGHGLMQAIARVNRVFKDKPGGLVVDYLGLTDQLRQALVTYTEAQGTGDLTLDQDEAVAALLEQVEVCRGLFHGFDWSAWTRGTATEKLSLLPAAQEHILAQEDGKARLDRTVGDLAKAFALSVPDERALALRDEVAFYQAVRAVLLKHAPGDGRPKGDVEHAIRQLVSQAIVSDEVVDVFAAAGLRKPDVSILSDEFLAQVRGLPQRNVAVELLRKLLAGEVRQRRQRNVVQARSFEQLLDEAVRRYQNRAVETAQVIEELIALAREMRAAQARGEALGLSDDELAFYDALGVNESAVAVLGEPTLKLIARELVQTVRRSVTIDWTVRDNVRAQLRVLVKRILRKYGYPPDRQEVATRTVLEQAEVLPAGWAE